MRRVAALLVMLGCVALVLIPTASFAQKYRSPEWNGCIQQFYDPDFYNWLSFRNTCSEALAVTYIGRKPGYGGSLMELRPGRKNSTGWTRKEVDGWNGFELYVCPLGYVPVDANDQYVRKVDTKFRCRQKSIP